MIYTAYILVYGQHWNICVFIYQLGLENTQKSLMLYYINKCKPPWRNWLARSAVNRKVGGSSPPGGAYFFANSKQFLLLSNVAITAGLQNVSDSS